MDTDSTPAVILSSETGLNGSSQMAGHSIAPPSALGYITMTKRELLYGRDLHAPGNGRTNVNGSSFGVNWGSSGNGCVNSRERLFFFCFVAGAGANSATPSSSDDDATGDAGGVFFATRRRFFFFFGASESDDDDDDDDEDEDEDEDDDDAHTHERTSAT